ncbi:hypothetical protein TEA_005403 [Camellia sinensis var. sinensis]|uniref:PRA1 family protein n=1 Tax=Camellia sinensis var. sinensis TaxID=542762 RepID=A0A4V3WK75_CAMSN|nr:hypothetical protein TEA_005403 [Camellia sinensis var. sinensis]
MAPKAVVEEKPSERKPAEEKKSTVAEKASAEKKPKAGKKLLKEGRAAAGDKKKKRSKKSIETYKIYIFKVLKQVYPDIGISSKAMGIMNRNPTSFSPSAVARRSDRETVLTSCRSIPDCRFLSPASNIRLRAATLIVKDAERVDLFFSLPEEEKMEWVCLLLDGVSHRLEMDWGNVTAEDLIEALREVDWSSPPRPLSEFFSRFTIPRSSSKWNSRLKCNLYYYRTNYFMMIVLILGLGFLRRPLAIVAAALTALTIAFLNDSGKGHTRDLLLLCNTLGTFSEKVTRTVRQFSPHLAAKMRPPLTPVLRGRPSAKRAIYICGRPRWVFVLIFSIVSFILWFVSCGLLSVLWALAIGLLATILHASFRTPNLKARLNTFREEFRAVWRNYSEL